MKTEELLKTFQELGLELRQTPDGNRLVVLDHTREIIYRCDDANAARAWLAGVEWVLARREPV